MSKKDRKIILIAQCLINPYCRVHILGQNFPLSHELVNYLIGKKVGIIQYPCPETTAMGLKRNPQGRQQYDNIFFRQHCKDLLKTPILMVREFIKNGYRLTCFIGLGVIFMTHGAQKALGLFGGSGIEGFVKMLTGLGLSPPEPLAYTVASIELLGGFFLILGLFTKVAASLLFAVMAAALLKVHLAKRFFLMNGGYEYNIVLIAACLSLVISGSGALGVTKRL